jgi:hypothetical protein
MKLLLCLLSLVLLGVSSPAAANLKRPDWGGRDGAKCWQRNRGFAGASETVQ